MASSPLLLRRLVLLFASAVLPSALCAEALPVTVTVDARAPRTPINPLIYGTNHDHPGWTGATLRRWGGNATDTYNWETGFNNSGSDWQQASGTWLSRYVPAAQAREPAAAIVHFHEESLRRGVPSIVGLPLAGYVAADANGPVAPGDAAPSPRWKKIVPAKGAPFSLSPDLEDDVVYVDELVNFLVQKFGSAASPRGIRYYAIGNEPGLWHHTHPLVQREKTLVRDYLARAIALARAVKRVDPDARIIGPASFGLFEIYGFCEAPDWPEVKKQGGYHWFADYFLDEFAKASRADGRRLLDVFSVHKYVEGEIPTHGGVHGIIQNPRTLWDPEYREPSYLGEVVRGSLATLPRLHASIARYYPGTALGITEYDATDADGYAGGLATVDLLGIFGRQGLELATSWPFTGFDQERPGRYAVAAHRLYRDYDGQGGVFGSLLLEVENSDAHGASIYAAAEPGTDRLHLILLNKHLHATNEYRVRLKGARRQYRSALAYGFNEHTAQVAPMPGVPEIEANRFTYHVPRRTAVHLVLSTAPAQPPFVTEFPKAAPKAAAPSAPTPPVPVEPTVTPVAEQTAGKVVTWFDWQDGLQNWRAHDDDHGVEQVGGLRVVEQALELTPLGGFRLAARRDVDDLVARLQRAHTLRLQVTAPRGAAQSYLEVGMAMTAENLPFTGLPPRAIISDGRTQTLEWDLSKELKLPESAKWGVLFLTTNTAVTDRPGAIRLGPIQLIE
jgi:mannan endo-1,4-beta-mannosidase